MWALCIFTIWSRSGDCTQPTSGSFLQKKLDSKAEIDYIVFVHCFGEMTELAEGARLLSEYTGLNLYRGFKSLSLRQLKKQAPFWGFFCIQKKTRVRINSISVKLGRPKEPGFSVAYSILASFLQSLTTEADGGPRHEKFSVHC